MLDVVWAKVQHFVQYRPRHCAEAMPAHRLAAETHVAQRGSHCVFRHGALHTANTREYVLMAPSKRVQLVQDRYRLLGQRDEMRCMGLAGGVTPLGGL